MQMHCIDSLLYVYSICIQAEYACGAGYHLMIFGVRQTPKQLRTVTLNVGSGQKAFDQMKSCFNLLKRTGKHHF